MSARCLAAPTLAAAPPCAVLRRARTSTKTSVPSRSRRIRSISPPRALRSAGDPIIALHQRQPARLQPGQGAATRHRRRPPWCCHRTPALNIDPSLLLQAAAAAAGAPALPARHTVRGGHADRQPGRPDAARHPRAARASTRWPARTRGSAAQLLRHLGLQRPLLALHAPQRARGGSRGAGAPGAGRVGGLCQRRRHAGSVGPGRRAGGAGRGRRAQGGADPRGQQRAGGLERGRRRGAAPAFAFVGFLPAKGGERRDRAGAGAGRSRHAGAVRGAAPHRRPGWPNWRPRHPSGA